MHFHIYICIFTNNIPSFQICHNRYLELQILDYNKLISGEVQSVEKQK